MQRSRRNDPYPFTWEIPTAIVCGVLVVLAFGIHIGRAAANLLAGAGWTWPARDDLFRSLPDVVTGHAGAGLTGHSAAAGSGTLWACVAVTELALLVLLGWAFKEGLDRWGPHRLHGMATRAEAERMLGRTRLGKVGAVIRPDLYGKERNRA